MAPTTLFCNIQQNDSRDRDIKMIHMGKDFSEKMVSDSKMPIYKINLISWCF